MASGMWLEKGEAARRAGESGKSAFFHFLRAEAGRPGHGDSSIAKQDVSVHRTGDRR